VGWHVHFVVSSRLSMLFLAEYNLEGMPTSRLYNFRKYAPVCLTYASSQSQHMQILPRRFFDGFEQNDQFDFDGIAKYEVKLQFVKDAPRGFSGRNWTKFLVRENVSEGQKMVVCHAGGFRFNVTVFDFNGVAIETFFFVLDDDAVWI
ncbi:transcription elongation factor TFIIS, partial [Tanacetum coccineum]